MPNVVLQAKSRLETGSANSRRLRRKGRIPAALYGRAGKSLSLDLDAKEFVQGTKGITESTIINVAVDGKTYDVFVKETQRNIIDGAILHIDFYEVESGVVLRAKIGVIVQGNPVGVREGGIFENPTHEIEVECLPKDLPPRIIVDVSSLKANQSIHVRDIPLGEGIKLISNPDKVIALVKFARAEAAAATEAAPAADAAAAAPAAGGEKKA